MVVCVGRLCEQKGQMLLLSAAREMARRGEDFELVLAGDGEMRPELERLIDDYGLRDRVRITGWVSGEQVRELLLQARALILPSFAEGLPVVIMEAMALARPSSPPASPASRSWCGTAGKGGWCRQGTAVPWCTRGPS
jgi:colanic acid/amylovoran biosynthesis glycosyltransferase